ncbi:MAG TPA: carboxypeptidase regulatory-like domain-containing protein [Thermoanaerobaculia bacterium]|nr:carboxypeptidase regulatory-like domain-containing protein [Thermoanaerobaculia bacterium]
MKRFLAALFCVFSCFTAASAQDLQREAVPSPVSAGQPAELTMKRAGSTNIDLRAMPEKPRFQREKPERDGPPLNPVELPGAPTVPQVPSVTPGRNVPAPPPLIDFDGLDRENWGAGSPADPTGDVGPDHYIQAVNTSVGIYDKTDGSEIAAFTFDTLMSQGNFGNQCDTQNFGDPIVLYDTFEDRWVLTDFAFTIDGLGNVTPPEAFQCIAVSQTGDPVAGGWYFYSIRMDDFLNDYPKLGVWPDGIYMAANMFGFPAGGGFATTRVWAFNKAQMYAGAPTVQVVTFDQGAGDFTLLPSNARLQTGTPPPGTPNYFVSTWNFLNALTVYKFHVDWERISLSTFTGPDVPLAATGWPNAAVANAPQPGTAQLLDVLQIRAMMQNQYTNFGGVESLWNTHTVRRQNTTGFAAPRWYQVDVTGGTVAANLPQAATWDPDAANVIHRFMPSLALDRAGNLALGYSTSNNAAPNFPSIKYAGRLAADPVNTFSLTEQTMFAGTASQTTSARWGDYTTMTLDPDGCTFWYTNQYANPVSQDFDKRWKTRIGSFKYDECTPVGEGGTVSGTVTATVGGAPISGATVELGSRTTTTNGSGFYSFTDVPAGIYPEITASAPGYESDTATSIAVADGATTTQDFSLDTAPVSACLTDTTQADFLTGVGEDIDLATSPDEVILLNVPNVDQQNLTVTTSGFGFNSTAWAGQTFVAGATGQLTQVDLDLFCAGCTGTTPNLTVSIRATTGSPAVPTGADLATATIPGFNTGAGGIFSAFFGTPATITAGTQYAIVIRAVANPSAGTYAYVCSCTAPNSNPYANGQRVTSANSGATWVADVTTGGRDLGFTVFVQTGFPPSGEFESGLKDSNPPVGFTPTWTTISWNATTPADTAISFQVAASNSASGPFNFVGPDGTAGTFYTSSGGSLSQFNGNRYLKYKAYLTSTNSAATPSLEDVEVCFVNVAPPDLTIAKSDGGASVEPGGTVAYTLTYSNVSTTGATGVVITETVPANTTFNPGASTAGWACAPDNNAGSICTLAVGAVAGTSGDLMAIFAVTTADPRPAGVFQVSNTASITDDGASGADPTPGNNTASDTTLLVGLDYYTIVPPCRLLDTRISGGPISSGVETEFATAGQCSIPADAVAIAVNVTVIDPSNGGHVEIYPLAGERPFTSTVNFGSGQVRPNNAIVPLAADGSFQVFFVITGGGTSELVIDVVGYFR